MKKSNILVLAIAAAATLTFAQDQKKVGWSTGYYAGWAQGKYPVNKINWKAYTHMCHFSITPNGGAGGVKMDMGLTDASCKGFVAEAHKNNVKALICLGGAGTGGNFQAASANATIRATFIKNIIDFMQKYGYDGVDMDWEEIGGKEANYQALNKELRAELDKITPRPMLTVAMANYIANACGPVYQVFDQMNNMCYWTHASGLTNDFKALVDKGIPKLKMGVGIGFDYEEGNPEVDCDPTSVKQKCDYAIANNYGGVMVWAIEQDTHRYNGQEPSHAALLPYVPAASTRLAGPSFRQAGQEILSMTIVGNGSMGKPIISYMVPQAAELAGAVLDLGLYSSDGRMVKTLVHGKSAPGAYTVALDQSYGEVRPGAYVVKLSAGSESRTAQTLILK
ncbi:MAG: chitinase [Fibrobacteres bacterium]|nr:chitinase [Fibrobacterota bacterium]